MEPHYKGMWMEINIDGIETIIISRADIWIKVNNTTVKDIVKFIYLESEIQGEN
jgi:hypothetical protein